MSLYKQKKQKNDATKSAYTEDYRTRRSSRTLRTVIFILILAALFALGFFVIEPLLEKYYHSVNDEKNGETEPQTDDGFTVIDVSGLFSEGE